MTIVHHRQLDTPIGSLTLGAVDDGIVEVLFEGHEPTRTDNLTWANDNDNNPDHPVLTDAADQLTEYFVGDRQTFDLPLVPSGTDFQLECWGALDQIPFGETVSYGDQAEHLGRPKASRAVGAANGRNHLPIIRPCHRVIGANGSLTGFAGGIDAKRWLLNHEATVAQQSLF